MGDDFAGVRCLVTGASSGLGRAVAESLARRGARVVATGRSAERLSAWRGSCERQGVDSDRLRTFAADLTSAADRMRLVESVSDTFRGELDLLVQSAGVGAYGRFLSHDPEILRQVFDINVFAVADLARECHPLLSRGCRPAMLVIGSVVARRGLPGRAEYSASKFAVAGLVESLRAEWTFDGIRVLLVNPGFTRTDFERNVLVDTTYVASEPRRRMSPELVADRSLHALARGRNEISLTLSGRALLLVNRLCPRFVDWGLGRWTRKLYATHLPLRETTPVASPTPPLVESPSSPGD